MRVNAALREWLLEIVLTRAADNEVTLQPMLGPDAARRWVRDQGLQTGLEVPALKSHQPGSVTGRS